MVITSLQHPDEFKVRFAARLTTALPGAEAQDAMTSRARMPLEVYLQKNPDYRTSAVAMLLYPLNDIVHTLIIERPAYEGVHSGQLALPGGKTEAEDRDAIHTAIRETREEVGVLLDRSQILGALSPLYIPPSNFLVLPFAAWLNEQPKFTPDTREVAGLLEVPLHTFLDESIKSRRRIPVAKKTFIEAPCYLINGKVLWGATAMMFSEIEQILNGK